MTKKHEPNQLAGYGQNALGGHMPYKKTQDQPSHSEETNGARAQAGKLTPPPDYYQINYFDQAAEEAPWQVFPTREEADAKAESLKANGASAVKVSPRWGYRYRD